MNDDASQKRPRLTMPMAIVIAAVLIAAAIVLVFMLMSKNSEAACDRWREDTRAYFSRTPTGTAEFEVELMNELMKARPEDCPMPMPGG